MAPTAAVLKNNTTASIKLLTSAATTCPFLAEGLLSALLALQTFSFSPRQGSSQLLRPGPAPRTICQTGPNAWRYITPTVPMGSVQLMFIHQLSVVVASLRAACYYTFRRWLRPLRLANDGGTRGE